LSTQQKDAALTHEEIIETLTQALYEQSTMAVFFHSTIAEQIGLGATEEKTLFMLSGFGSLTAGEIAARTGLTTPSITSLIDRLESKGFVRRVRDTHDRRRVIVELDQEKFGELMGVFNSLGGLFENLMDGYSDEQLLTIMSFIRRAIERSQAAIDSLRQNPAKPE
jgi:DNA-binding MarR family transcriptional regulator